ncbi:MAG: response regulator [Pyrinomonadaceae bacterium]
MNQTVIAAVDDMLFASKIRATAEHLSVSVRFARNRDAVLTAAREGIVDLIVIDLQAQKIDAIELAKELKADERLRKIPVVGFFSHVLAELQRKAIDAGVDRVVPRSVFSRDMAQILTADYSPRDVS